jgi:hypothetical protein
LLATRPVDDRQQDAGDPKAVHREAEDLTAVEASGGIDEESRDQHHGRNHYQQRGRTLCPMERLTIREREICDCSHQKQQVTRAKDQPGNAIEMRNIGDVTHVLAGQGKSEQR